MRLTTRCTHGFVEVKTDEIEVIIFKDSKDVQEIINNLLSVAIELTAYTDGSINEFLNDL